MNEYQPLFMEETLLVNIYGSDEEISRFNRLMTGLDDENNLVEITLLIEEIKRRSVANMDWHCCAECNKYRVCKINWLRGERNLSRNCCSMCPLYEDCRARRRRNANSAGAGCLPEPAPCEAGDSDSCGGLEPGTPQEPAGDATDEPAEA